MNTNDFTRLVHLLLRSNPSAYFMQVLMREAGVYYRAYYAACYSLTLDEKEAAVLDSLGRFREYINLSTATLDSLDTVETTLSKIVSDSYTNTLTRSFKARGLSMV